MDILKYMISFLANAINNNAYYQYQCRYLFCSEVWFFIISTDLYSAAGLKKVALMQVYSFRPLSCQCLNTVWKQGFKRGFMWLNSANAPLPWVWRHWFALLNWQKKKEYDSAALDPCCWQNTYQAFNHPLLLFSISPAKFLTTYPLQGGLEHKPCVLQGGTQSIRGSAYLSSLSLCFQTKYLEWCGINIYI